MLQNIPTNDAQMKAMRIVEAKEKTRVRTCVACYRQRHEFVRMVEGRCPEQDRHAKESVPAVIE